MIHADGGEEILPVRRVEVRSVRPPVMGDSVSTDTLFYEMEDGTVLHTIEGTVYVMNDNGKTVASYHLDYPGPLDRSISKDKNIKSQVD